MMTAVMVAAGVLICALRRYSILKRVSGSAVSLMRINVTGLEVARESVLTRQFALHKIK